MAFLDDLEQLETATNAPPQSMRYPIVFFIRDPASSAKVDGSEGSIQGLRRVDVVLESSNIKHSLRVMRLGLGKLFDACKIEHSMEKLSQQQTILPKRFVL